MQKYKIVASKSKKKYTLIISADSESQAKEKLHSEDYSILSIHEVEDSKIIGNKFLFQIEKNGEIKNGIIVGKDIFKVYIKLRDELGYNIIFLYPEGDAAHDNAEKKQKIIDQLIMGYTLQKKEIKQKQTNKNKEESFYLQKKLNETYILINKAIEKFDSVFNNREQYSMDDDTFYKLEKIYEKLIHVKSSTNLSKLKEIGELALIKIAKIELQNIEEHKNKESRELLKETNNLLKEIGSHQHFIEKDKDIKRKIKVFIIGIISTFSDYKKGTHKANKSKKQLIDKDSYNFLKTVLLLEKYQDKLDVNSKDIQKNMKLFLNPFSKSELKEKILLKRRVIKQNISILRAKKSGGIGSYTSVKKGYGKVTNTIFDTLTFLGNITIFLIYAYIILFLSAFSLMSIETFSFQINPYPIVFLLLSFIVIFLLHISKNIVFLSLNLVFFSFIFIFSLVNF